MACWGTTMIFPPVWCSCSSGSSQPCLTTQEGSNLYSIHISNISPLYHYISIISPFNILIIPPFWLYPHNQPTNNPRPAASLPAPVSPAPASPRSCWRSWHNGSARWTKRWVWRRRSTLCAALPSKAWMERYGEMGEKQFASNPDVRTPRRTSLLLCFLIQTIWTICWMK